MDQEPVNQSQNETKQTVADKASRPKQQQDATFVQIKRITAWVMIISAVAFAFIGVLAIWQVFGDAAGDVVWRAFSSLGIIAFAALVVNVASRAAEGRH